MEVFNAAGNRVYQQVANNQSFAANETRNFSFNWVSPANQAVGQYTLSVGVFKNDWSSNYTWSSNAASFAVNSGSVSPTPAAIVAPTNTVSPTVTPTRTTSPTVAPTITVAPTAVPTATPIITVAPTAVPTVVPTITVAPTATAIPTPASSQYTLAIWWPSPGVTLQGIQTIKAKVNDLDLSQYTMSWSVDSGRQSGLMADQLNEGAHKEATITTSQWTWNGKGPYTITFTAKDLSGRVIATNSVQVNV